MSFQIQAGKLKSHSGSHGSNAREGYITVSRNSDGFLSKRREGGREKKEGFCHVLTLNFPRWSGYNMSTVESREHTQVNMLTDISHMAEGSAAKFRSLSPL